jgi:hypothetical protein
MYIYISWCCVLYFKKKKELKLQKKFELGACNPSFLRQKVFTVHSFFILNENTYFPNMPFQFHKKKQSGDFYGEIFKENLEH